MRSGRQARVLVVCVSALLLLGVLSGCGIPASRPPAASPAPFDETLAALSNLPTQNAQTNSTPGAAGQPTPAPALDQAKRIYDQLETAYLAQNLPERMNLGETRKVRLMLGLTAPQATPAGDSAASGADFQPLPEVYAQLTGDGFRITPSDGQKQVIPAAATTAGATWDWTITPLAAGKQTLTLIVWSRVETPGRAQEVWRKSYSRPVQVNVTLGYRAAGVLQRNITWLPWLMAGLFGALIAAALKLYTWYMDLPGVRPSGSAVPGFSHGRAAYGASRRPLPGLDLRRAATRALYWVQDNPTLATMIGLPLFVVVIGILLLSLINSLKPKDPRAGLTVVAAAQITEEVYPTGTPVLSGRAAQAGEVQPGVEGQPGEVIATPTRPETYAEKRDEWPICIARRYNLDIAAFFAANNLNMNSKPPVGTVFKLPKNSQWNASFGSRALKAHPAKYTVAAGDSLNAIACKFGDVFPEQILAVNGLSGPEAIKTGMVLQIP